MSKTERKSFKHWLQIDEAHRKPRTWPEPDSYGTVQNMPGNNQALPTRIYLGKSLTKGLFTRKSDFALGLQVYNTNSSIFFKHKYTSLLQSCTLKLNLNISQLSTSLWNLWSLLEKLVQNKLNLLLNIVVFAFIVSTNKGDFSKIFEMPILISLALVSTIESSIIFHKFLVMFSQLKSQSKFFFSFKALF